MSAEANNTAENITTEGVTVSSAVTGLDNKAIIKKFRTNEKDCGSPEVQVALLTRRLEVLTNHFKTNRQDIHSQRGMMNLISRRKQLLQYLKQENLERYKTLINTLGLRK